MGRTAASGALGLIAVTVLAYLPVLWAGYINDDQASVLGNDLLRSIEGLRTIWVTGLPYEHYWPVTYTVFWIERALWDVNPIGYHAVNLALHVTNVLMLRAVLSRMNVPGAVIAAALFALHPVHVESVAWITELKDVLSAAFYLGAFWTYLSYEDRPRLSAYVATASLFIAGMLSKSIVVSFPVALFLYTIWKGRQWDRRRTLPIIGLGVLAVALVAVDLRVVANVSSETFALSLLDRVMLASRCVWFYLGTVLWPSDLIPIYPRWSLEPASIWYWIPALSGIVVFGALAAIRRPSTNVALLLLVFFTVTLAPVLGMVDFSYMSFSFVADRYLYLASIGPIVGVAVLFTKLRWPMLTSRFGHLAFFGLLATLGTLTWQQSQLYRDESTIYRATLERNPDAWLAHLNLGPILEREGRLGEAIEHYSAAVALKPDSVDAHFNLGVALSEEGRLLEATNAFEAAIRLKPKDEEAHNSLGIVLARLGRYADAIREYESAIAFKPDFADAENNLGVALMTIGRVDDGLRHFEAALRIRPAYRQAHINLAGLLRELGRTAESDAHYRAAEAIAAAGGDHR